MKGIWILLASLLLGASLSLHGQEVTVDGAVYEVKKKGIFKDGIDVSNTLAADEKARIMSVFEKKKLEIEVAKKAQKEKEKAEKEQKKAEKAQKRAEKAQKKAEKQLKQQQKAQANFDKATKKHKDAVNRYEKLKNKGKLSPQDEAKWLKKIEKLNANTAKAKRKL